MSPKNIIAATDIATFAPEVDTSKFSAATLSGVIAQATTRMASFCNVAGFDLNTETTETERAVIKNDGELWITPRRRPIVTVNSVSLVKGSFSSTLTLINTNGLPLYQIPYPNNQFVFPNSFLTMAGTYLGGGSSNLVSMKGSNLFATINYLGGWQTIPDDLKRACVMYTIDILNHTNYPAQSAGLNEFRQGSYQESYIRQPKPKSLMVQEAENMLMEGDYVRMVLF